MFDKIIFLSVFFIPSWFTIADSNYKITNENTLIMKDESNKRKSFKLNTNSTGNPSILLTSFDNHPALLYSYRSINNHEIYFTLENKNGELYKSCYYIDLRSGLTGLSIREYKCNIDCKINSENDSDNGDIAGSLLKRYDLYDTASFIQNKKPLDLVLNREGGLFTFLRYKTDAEIYNATPITIVYDNNKSRFFTDNGFVYVENKRSSDSITIKTRETIDEGYALKKLIINSKKMSPTTDIQLNIKRTKQDSISYQLNEKTEKFTPTQRSILKDEVVFLLSAESKNNFCHITHLSPENTASNVWIKCDDISGVGDVAPAK